MRICWSALTTIQIIRPKSSPICRESARNLGIDVERVAALKPDLVLSSLTVPGHEKVVESLDVAGIAHIALEPIRLEDVYSDIIEIGNYWTPCPRRRNASGK